MTKILSATPVVSSFPKKTEKTIDKFYMKAYYKYFKIKLGNQDKTWAPQIIYKSCRTAGKQTALKFGIPMIWPEPANHFGDCYFCMTNLVGYNKKNRENILYPSIPSATWPIPHSDENPVPVFKELLDIPISAASLAPQPVPEELTESNSNPERLDNDNHIDYHECLSEPNRFNQDHLSDLIRDLNLPKEST